MDLKINDVVKFLVPGADRAVGLAVSSRCNQKTWIRLEKASERPGYRQLGICRTRHVKLLEDLYKAGRLSVADISGLGCGVVTLNSSED